MNKQDKSLTPPPTLKKLPYDKGLPIFGHTFAILRDPLKWGNQMIEKHGNVFRYRAFFQDSVLLVGKEALELIWLDKSKSFSTELGYKPFVGALTDTSLLLMDFEKHRSNRQILNPAFKANVMKVYLEQMHSIIGETLPQWAKQRKFKFYPEVKQLTLDVATSAFLGIEESSERQKINQALTDLFASLLSIIRLPIPGTAYHRGMRAKDYIESMLLEEIPRRKKTDGNDIFTRLCHETDENGDIFSDDEIVGHLITFWVAGHDTLASSLTSVAYQLAKHPEWQHKARAEVKALDLNGRQPNMEDLNQLSICDYIFKEALRLQPPITNTPRKTLKDVEYMGYHVPAGMLVGDSIYGVHRKEDFWPAPETFDPMRFAPENTPKDRPKFAWVPFGGGPHKCIGMIFAQIQAKVFLVNLLENYALSLPEDYEIDIQLLPTPRPRDGLPVKLTSLS